MPKTVKRLVKKDVVKNNSILGQLRRKLASDHLPSKQKVLFYLKFKQNDPGKLFVSCVNDVSLEVAKLWNGNGFPTESAAHLSQIEETCN